MEKGEDWESASERGLPKLRKIGTRQEEEEGLKKRDQREEGK